MAKVRIKAVSRKGVGSNPARHARAEGKVPAVLYGKGEASLNLMVDGHELETALRSGARMLDVEIEGKVHTTFLREVQRDAIEEHLVHVDFHRVRMDEALRTKVPLHFKGTPAGTAEGGVLNQLFHDILIECLPADLPDAIEVPVGHLKLDQGIHFREVALPAKVKLAGDPDALLVNCQRPKVEAEAAAGAEGEAKEPEVLAKGKQDEEGAAKGEAAPAKGGEKAAKPEKGDEKKK